MSQINLKLRKKLVYSPKNFFWYQSLDPVKSDFESFDRNHFASYLVLGKQCSGKTHLALTLLEEYRSKGLATEIVASLNQLFSLTERSELPDVILFDDTENQLGSEITDSELIQKLINCFDLLKHKQIRLLIFTRQKPITKNTPLDSRFKEMIELPLGKLTVQEQLSMIEVIARQRAYKFTPALLEYVSKRVHREVSEIIEFFNRLEYIQAESNSKVNRDLVSKAF